MCDLKAHFSREMRACKCAHTMPSSRGEGKLKAMHQQTPHSSTDRYPLPLTEKAAPGLALKPPPTGLGHVPGHTLPRSKTLAGVRLCVFSREPPELVPVFPWAPL